MTHNDYQEHISQLIDGELGAKDQQALFLHLSECGECRNFLNSLLALRSQLAAGSPVWLPAGFDTRIENADALQYNRPAAFRLALAASIAFILLMSSLLFGPQILQSTTTGQPGGMVSTAPYGQPFPLTQ
ncbi:MAG TPA: zf-HC2 domain-containing protein [Bacteroidota bacterium]